VIDTGRAVPFSQILRKRDFESKENKDVFSVLLSQTSHTHPINLPEHPLHRHSEIFAVPDGHLLELLQKGSLDKLISTQIAHIPSQ